MFAHETPNIPFTKSVLSFFIAIMITVLSYRFKNVLSYLSLGILISSIQLVLPSELSIGLWKTIALVILLTILYLVIKRYSYFKTMKRVVTIGDKFKAPNFEKWNERWNQEFQTEKQRLEKVLIPKFQQYIRYDGIFHIGSTAVKDIQIAVPIHDMILGLNGYQLPEGFVDTMETLGYRYVGTSPHDPDGNDHWFFLNIDEAKKNGITTAHGFDLHVSLTPAHHLMDGLIGFTMYLNKYPEQRKIYEDKKIEASNLSFSHYKRKKSATAIHLVEKSQEWIQKEGINFSSQEPKF